jgi:glycosyltransferase involved in cell wall biosynthesis
LLARGAPENFTWIRDWKTLEQIAAEITEADVCLGVFGGPAKASRVLPFKLYYAMAAGKAIVTQAEYSLPAGIPPLPARLVDTPDTEVAAEQLAQAIRLLLSDGAERAALGWAARAYFESHLSGDAVIRQWRKLLADCQGDGRNYNPDP